MERRAERLAEAMEAEQLALRQVFEDDAPDFIFIETLVDPPAAAPPLLAGPVRPGSRRAVADPGGGPAERPAQCRRKLVRVRPDPGPGGRVRPADLRSAWMRRRSRSRRSRSTGPRTACRTRPSRRTRRRTPGRERARPRPCWRNAERPARGVRSAIGRGRFWTVRCGGSTAWPATSRTTTCVGARTATVPISSSIRKGSTSAPGSGDSAPRSIATGSFPTRRCRCRGTSSWTFNVHKDGRLTDLTVERPSTVDAFTSSAFNAIRGSNPTYPVASRVPGRGRVLHGDVLFQRAAAGSLIPA